MHSPINKYGDKLILTTIGHGSDIAAQRMDDLDRAALFEVLKSQNPKPNTIDLGCGFGWQGIRFSVLGANSHLYDLLAESPQIGALRESLNLSLQYISGDIKQSIQKTLPNTIEIAFSQRFIHYLTNDEAIEVLTTIGKRMTAGSSFFISASGIDSELGTRYEGKQFALNSRFSRLTKENQIKHGIHEPVCLYSENDLERTMDRAGFKAQNIWRSDFGNIKGIFKKSA